MSDPFVKLWNGLSGQFTDEQNRYRIEDVAVMLGSVGVAEAIPGVGEVQMALQFIDFIDPYGYNQALDRSSLDKLLTDQYQKIVDMQNSIADCYQNGTAASCKSAGITDSQLADFKSLPQSLQDKRVKTVASWAVPYPPEVNYPDMLLCTLATSPKRIEDCQDPDYKKIYLDYFNKNAPTYQANAQQAFNQAIQQQAASLSGGSDGTEDDGGHKNKIKTILIIVYVLVVLGVFVISRKVFG